MENKEICEFGEPFAANVRGEKTGFYCVHN